MEQVKAGLVELQLGDKVSVVPNANKPWTFDWQYDEPFFVVGMRLDRGAIDITIAETAGGKDRTDGFNPGDLALVERATPQPAAVDGLVRALRPFALVAEHDIGEDESDFDLFKSLSYNHAPRITVGDIRRAHQALTKIKQP